MDSLDRGPRDVCRLCHALQIPWKVESAAGDWIQTDGFGIIVKYAVRCCSSLFRIRKRSLYHILLSSQEET